MTFMREAKLRIAAADHERHHQIAVLPARDVRAAGDDLAGNLEARNVGRTLRRRVKAHALHDVRPIDPRGRDLDYNLARRRPRHGTQFRREDVRAAGFADGDDRHPVGQWYHGKCACAQSGGRRGPS